MLIPGMTIRPPLTEEQARRLKVGDTVYLSGEVIITGGLPTFRRIMEFAGSGRQLPVDLEGSALLHLVNFNRQKGEQYEVLYVNPTTSTRFNDYMPDVIRTFNLRVVGGKGGLSMESAAAMKETGCVYLAFLGAGSPFLSASVREVLAVGWADFITTYRLVKLRVEGLGPAIVAIDSHGNSMYEDVRLGVERDFPRIVDRLRARRTRQNGVNG